MTPTAPLRHPAARARHVRQERSPSVGRSPGRLPAWARSWALPGALVCVALTSPAAAADPPAPYLLTDPPVALSGPPAALAAAPDGSLIVAVPAGRPEARLWAGDLTYRGDVRLNDPDPVTAALATADGRVVLGVRGRLEVIDVLGQGRQATLTLPGDPTALAWLPDGRVLAALDGGGLLAVDLAAGPGPLAPAPGGLTHLAVSRDGRTAAGCGPDAAAIVRLQGKGKTLAGARIDGCAGAAWYGETAEFATAEALARWDSRGRPVGPAPLGLRAAAYARGPDGTRWLLDPEGRLRRGDEATPVGPDELVALQVLPDGRLLVAERAGRVRLLDAAGADLSAPRRGLGGAVVALRPTTTGLLLGGADGDVVSVRGADQTSLLDLSAPVAALSASDDGGVIAVAHPRGASVLRDGAWALIERKGSWTAAAVTPDGGLVLVGGQETGLLALRPGADPEPVRLDGHVTTLLAAPDGQLIAAALANGDLRVLDRADPRRMRWGAHLPVPPTDGPLPMAFLPDGRVAAASGHRVVVATPGLTDASVLLPSDDATPVIGVHAWRGEVLVVRQDGRVVAVDPHTLAAREVLPAIPLGFVRSAIDGDVLLMGVDDGAVLARPLAP